jgi:crossover junction endodeoxyribonuclease RuvC
MIFLGIDPGIATTGYGFIKKEGSKLTILDYGVVTTKPGIELSKRIFLLAQQLRALLQKYQPQHVAIEELFFGINVKTAMSVSQARGVMLFVFEEFGIPIAHYTPTQVKSGICGYGKAEKKQVQYMVQRILGLQKIPRPDDAADALAIAICHAQTVRLKSLV